MKYLFLLLLLTSCVAPKNKEWFPYRVLKNGDLTAYARLEVPLKYPLTFKNAGQPLLFTNQRGELRIYDEKILVPLEELQQIVQPNDPFFKHYMYEDFIFAYRTIYLNWDREVTNGNQVRESLSNRLTSLKIIQQKLEQYDKTNGSKDNWYNFYISIPRFIEPALSLRVVSIMSLPARIFNEYVKTAKITPQDAEKMRNSYEGSLFLWSILPIDHQEKLKNAILNLMILDLQLDKGDSLGMHYLQRDERNDLGIMRVLDGWVDFYFEDKF